MLPSQMLGISAAGGNVTDYSASVVAHTHTETAVLEVEGKEKSPISLADSKTSPHKSFRLLCNSSNAAGPPLTPPGDP